MKLTLFVTPNLGRESRARHEISGCFLSLRVRIPTILHKNVGESASVLYRRALILTHRRSSGRNGGPASSWTRSPRVWTLGGAEAPARRLRAALMSHHQGSMVLHPGESSAGRCRVAFAITGSGHPSQHRSGGSVTTYSWNL